MELVIDTSKISILIENQNYIENMFNVTLDIRNNNVIIHTTHNNLNSEQSIIDTMNYILLNIIKK